MSLRIALLTHSVRARGGVVHTLELAEALAAHGHSVTVIASAEPGERLFRAVDCAVATIALPALHGDLVAQVRQRIDTLTDALPALIDAGHFDVLHAQDSLSGNALATLRKQGRFAAPWLRTVHHLDHFDEPLLAEWQARAWQAADGVACISDFWQQRLQADHGCAAERMHNGVNLTRFHPHAGPTDAAQCRALGLVEPGRPVCLLVGGVEARKNSVRLLHAFAWLRRHEAAWAQAQLVVAGGASMLAPPATTSWACAQAASCRRSQAKACSRRTLFLRASTPPTSRHTGRPGSTRPSARHCAASVGPACGWKRVRFTPLCMRSAAQPWSACSRCCQKSLMQATPSAACQARACHSASKGSSKWSRWCTVRSHGAANRPCLRKVARALPLRLSCACSTSKWPASINAGKASVRVSMRWRTWATRSPCSAGSAMVATAQSTALNRRSPGSAEAITVTEWPCAASASASSSVCTTPPRARTEWVSNAMRRLIAHPR